MKSPKNQARREHAAGKLRNQVRATARGGCRHSRPVTAGETEPAAGRIWIRVGLTAEVVAALNRICDVRAFQAPQVGDAIELCTVATMTNLNLTEILLFARDAIANDRAGVVIKDVARQRRAYPSTRQEPNYL
jgi:hypothetical protein